MLSEYESKKADEILQFPKQNLKYSNFKLTHSFSSLFQQNEGAFLSICLYFHDDTLVALKLLLIYVTALTWRQLPCKEKGKQMAAGNISKSCWHSPLQRPHRKMIFWCHSGNFSKNAAKRKKEKGKIKFSERHPLHSYTTWTKMP